MTAVSKDMWMREAAKEFRHFGGTLPMPDIRPNDPLDYRTLWIGIDKDGDGLINPAEYNELLSRGFDKFDQNPQDGTLSMSESDRMKAWQARSVTRRVRQRHAASKSGILLVVQKLVGSSSGGTATVGFSWASLLLEAKEGT